MKKYFVTLVLPTLLTLNLAWGDDEGVTEGLFAAVSSGNAVVVSDILAQNPGMVHAVADDTLLRWVIRFAFLMTPSAALVIIKMLIARGADFYAKDREGFNAMDAAILSGQPLIVSFLLDLGLLPNRVGDETLFRLAKKSESRNSILQMIHQVRHESEEREPSAAAAASYP